MGFASTVKKKYGDNGLGGMSQEDIEAKVKQLGGADTQELAYQFGLMKRPEPPGIVDKAVTTAKEIYNNPSSLTDRLASEPAAVARQYGINQKALRRNELGYKLLTGTATEEDKKAIDSLGFQIQAESELYKNDPYEARAVGAIAPSVVKSLGEAGKGALLGASTGAVAGSVAGGIGAPAGAAIGAPAGALMKGVNYAREIEAGGAYLDMKERGIEDSIARKFAHAYGVGAGVLEITGMKYLKYIIPGGNKIASKIMSTALDKIIPQFTSKVGRAAGGAALGSAAEAGVEATQQLLQNTLEEIAARASDELEGTDVASKEKFIKTMQRGVVETFATTLVGMGITSIPGAGINILTDTKAGRAAVEQAAEEDPTTPPEETIKKKAAKKQAKKVEKTRIQQAAEDHEAKKLAEKKKAKKKPIKPIIPPEPPVAGQTVTKAPPAPVQPGIKEVPYEEPPVRAEIDKKMKEFQEKQKAAAPTVEPTAPVAPAPKSAPVKPVETERPIKDLFSTEVTPEGETKATPKLHDFIERHGGNVENNPYIDMMAREDAKGVTQNKLTKPAILLKDGTVVQGTELEEPWNVSKPAKAIEALPESYSDARKKAVAEGRDVERAKTGFIVDGKFVPSSVIVGKFKIGKRIHKQKKAIQHKTEKKFTDEVKRMEAQRDAWAQKVQESREPTQADIDAVEKLDKAAQRAANKAVNTNLGKHIDKTDMTSAAREALWMTVLSKSPEEIQSYVDGNNRPFFNFVESVITNQLKTFKKEDIAQKIGTNRSQVDTALNQGNLQAPAQLNEKITTTGEQVGAAEPVTPTDTYTPSDRRPGMISRIDPKTGLIKEQITPAQQRMELAKRRAEIKAAKKNYAKDKGNVRPTKTVAVAKKEKATPTQRLGKVGQAKPTGKVKKPSAKSTEAKVTNNKIAANEFETLKKAGGVVQKKDGTHAFNGVKGALLMAGKMNKTEGKGTYEAVPHPSSPGNYAVVNAKMWLAQLEGKIDTSPATPHAVESPIKDTINFSGGTVQTAGNIFDQIKERHDKNIEALAKAEEERAAAKEAKKPTGPVDLFGNAIKLMKDDSGSAGIINDAVESGVSTYTKIRNKLADKLDVEDKWDRIKKGKVGTALKNLHGKVSSYEKRETAKLMSFGKLVRMNDSKITKEQLVDCLLAAEDASKMDQLSEPHQRIAQWIRDYFDASEKEFADKGIDISFKRRMMADLIGKYLDETDWDNWQAMQVKSRRGKGPLAQIWKLENTEFVHIPPYLIKAILKSKKGMGAEFKQVTAKKIRKLENLTAKKRRSITLADVLDKEIIQKGDLDVYELLAHYMRNKANDFAIADLRDTALEEGMLKLSKTKPKKDQYGTWRKADKTEHFRGLGFYNQEKGTVWIHSSIINQLADSLETVVNRGVWTKAMSVAKMLQFYNPFFLPAYDVVQHLMMTGHGGGYKLPVNFVKAMKSVWTEDEDYLQALGDGLASKPYGITFEEFLNVKNRARRSGKMGAVPEFLMEWGTRTLLPKMDGKWRIPVLTAAYEASWQLAWKLDNVIRMMSYFYLRGKGHTSMQAAQTAAKFHGDYAGVPAATRKKLNYVFFTPTFQIAMVKLYKQMFTQFAKTWGGLKKSGTTKDQRRLAYGAIYTGGLMFAQEAIMNSLGFDTDDFDRRYKKKIVTKEGQRGELVLTIATPMNVPHRLLYRIISPFNPGTTNLLAAMADKWKWTLHPIYQTAIELASNRGVDGEPIYGTFDDSPSQWFKMAAYGTKRIAAMFNMSLMDAEQTKSSKEAKRQLIKMYGEFFGTTIPMFAFAYVRSPEDLRKAITVKRLARTFKYEAESAIRSGKKPPLSVWTKNFLQRLKDLEKEK